ncbi:Cd(II)/Pb(II)-responsive transcriptional regulator [Acidithiobacillus sp. IBUN Pt1247-S3]|uniref:Cd(II)/Pb(II)-responsive transcriptional regulator n=1 Tax=Acidithiobacillus sp. IBUN Pt1247-S3 TaxID=3166642 RepID=UPI0034E4B000
MRIGELATATGVETETIRYYERLGLMPAPSRQANGYRTYGPLHQERLAFIRHCRDLDMPLADIQALFQLLSHPEANGHAVEQLIDTQLARVQERLESLQTLATRLRQLRNSCSGEHPHQECGILQELRAAAQGADCVCHGTVPS